VCAANPLGPVAPNEKVPYAESITEVRLKKQMQIEADAKEAERIRKLEEEEKRAKKLQELLEKHRIKGGHRLGSGEEHDGGHESTLTEAEYIEPEVDPFTEAREKKQSEVEIIAREAAARRKQREEEKRKKKLAELEKKHHMVVDGGYRLGRTEDYEDTPQDSQSSVAEDSQRIGEQSTKEESGLTARPSHRRNPKDVIER